MDLNEAGRGAEIVQETRLFDENKQITFPMRSKEGLADYRYFPEPDLPAVDISPDVLDQIKVRHTLRSTAKIQQPAAEASHNSGLWKSSSMPCQVGFETVKVAPFKGPK